MPNEQPLLKVFLCHASQDKPIVRELSQRLFAEGWIDPWLDEKKLLPGQDWRLKIEEAVETSDIVIICLSSHSVSKEGFVQKELRYAREIALEKPDETIFLIPLRLESCETPRGLRFYQWVDYFGEKQDEGYSALVESLKLRHEQKLMLEEKERARQEKERLEREAAEKAAREKAERERAEKAAQEKSQRDASEKAVREKLEYEAVAKAKREKADREAAEKAAREKIEREKRGRETAEKAKRKKAEQEAAEKAARVKTAREKLERGTTEKPKPKVAKPKPVEEKPARKTDSVEPKAPETQISQHNSGTKATLWVIGFVVIFVIGVLFLNNSNITPPLTPISAEASTQTSTPLFAKISDAKGIQMMFVQAGDFTMGSDIGATDEKPAHKVYLDDFYIDEFEVTNALYRVCADAGVCSEPGSGGGYGDPNYANHPVTRVNWFQAKTYCEWRTARLPTEAEWEKAARGLNGGNYPWGERIDCNKTNLGGCKDDTTEVGSYEGGISPYGLYDVVGNVWEWVADWYSETYYQKSPSKNPPGPDLGQDRVARGGSFRWDNFPRVSLRVGYDPSNSGSLFDAVGFRCAKDATP